MPQLFQVGQPNIQVLSSALGKWMDVDILSYEGYMLLHDHYSGKRFESKHTYIITTDYLTPGSTTHVNQEALRVRPNEDGRTSWDEMLNKLKDGVPA